MSTELLAQMVELTSVGLAQKRLEQAIQVPRPDWVTQARSGGGDQPAGGSNPYTAAIGRLLAAPAPRAAA